MEEAVSGFTHIVGAPGTRELQQSLREGISRMGRLVRPPPVGASEGASLDEERWAVQNAWTVVAIATPAFCRSIRGRDLMRVCDCVRRNVITLWKRRPSEGYPWRSNVHLDLPERMDRQSLDVLIDQLNEKIQYLEQVYGGGGTRGPVGRPGLFAMLSSQRSQAELARMVRERLRQENITPWDYGGAPRRQEHYQKELAAKIRDAKVVIILLSAAWLRSDNCQRESRQAAELHKRRLWLRCDDSPPPGDADPADCFEFGPRHRKRTLEQLPRAIFPSRRKKRKGA